MVEAREGEGDLEGPLAILGGCGHVGLPLGIAFADTSVRVVLVDCNAERVQQVNAGVMPFRERGVETIFPRVVRSGLLRATADLAALRDAACVVITVGTPVDEFLDPSIREFNAAMTRSAEHLRSGQLVVLRSTVFPGITEHLGHLLTERGLDIDVAYCPERIAQGFALEELKQLPQIVSGMSPRAVERATRWFRRICPHTIELRPIEAELAKLFTNAWRYISFAISNQFYIVANQFGADFHRIRHAVCWQYPRMNNFANAGFAGGPCLLKDTMQLCAFNHGSFPLGQAAMLVNESMPYHVVQALKQRYDLHDMVVGILGMAFKANSDDPRSSLAYKLRKVLLLECRAVLCTDPYVADPELQPLETVLERADLLVIGACHDAYKQLQTGKPIVDISNTVVQS